MAIVCDVPALFFTLAPGTGSTALEEYLMQPSVQILLGSRKVPDMGCEIPSWLDKKHCTYKQAVSADIGVIEGMTVVTGTRNPFDYWYAEWFRHRHRWIKELGNRDSWVFKNANKMETIRDCCLYDFSEWVLRYHKKRKAADDEATAMLHPQYLIEAAHTLRMESIQQDLHSVLAHQLGHEITDKLPDMVKVNVTPRSDRDAYWQHYSPEARDVITHYYSDHLRLFGYHF